MIDDVLRKYVSCVVNDVSLAVRKAQFGSFHAYLAIEQPHGSAAAGLFWRTVRRSDPNTPFVLVAWSTSPQQLATEFKPGYDALVLNPRSPEEITTTLDCLISSAADRSLEARRLEARAVQQELSDRLHKLEQRVRLSRQSLARAQEHVMRAHAIREFLQAGGTKAFFDSAWENTFEELLQDSYGDTVPMHTSRTP